VTGTIRWSQNGRGYIGGTIGWKLRGTVRLRQGEYSMLSTSGSTKVTSINVSWAK
jgi:hypothetical protein